MGTDDGRLGDVGRVDDAGNAADPIGCDRSSSCRGRGFGSWAEYAETCCNQQRSLPKLWAPDARRLDDLSTLWEIIGLNGFDFVSWTGVEDIAPVFFIQ